MARETASTLASPPFIGHRRDVATALGALSAALSASSTTLPRLTELLRLRIAFHNQCPSCMTVCYLSALEDGLTESDVCSFERPSEAPDLTDFERAALHFADLFAIKRLAIDDAVYDDLRRYFTEDELVELGIQSAIAVGVGRLTATWDVSENLP